MKKTTILVLLVLGLMAFLPISAKAINIESADSVFIPKDQVVEGNFYVAAKNITVEGVINGDLIAAAQNITVKGKIAGDILSVSQNLNVEGEVEGNIRSIASAININNKVGKNLNILGENLLIGTQADIGWDALVGTTLTELRGKINGELNGFTDRLIIGGIVNKNVNLRLHNSGEENYKDIELLQGAEIKGDFNYSSANTINIDEKKINGNLNFKEVKQEKSHKDTLWSLIVAIFSALIVGLVLTTLFKNFLQNTIDNVEKTWGKNLLFGLIILIIVPIAVIFLAITIIGLPLAIITLVIWLILLYLSQVIFAIYFGSLIRKRLFKIKENNLIKSLLVGVPITWLIFAIPVIGGILSFLTILLVLGVFWNYRFKIFNK
ncbi:MAG: polymer-forming cytoskeletal protein [Candidatus Pacebacteria bacterium]|nr:polymer-forming cytoskeletal protein [Candidatus Paceibacterota bacterium]